MKARFIFFLSILLLTGVSIISQTKVYNSPLDQVESTIAINPTNTNNLIATARNNTMASVGTLVIDVVYHKAQLILTKRL